MKVFISADIEGIASTVLWLLFKAKDYMDVLIMMKFCL